LGILANDAERLLRAPKPDGLALYEAVSNVMIAFAEPPEAVICMVPDELASYLKNKNFALVGCGEEECDRLCGALERAGARPRLFEAGRAADPDDIAACSAAIVHVRPETIGTHWLHPLTVAELRIPLLLVGMRDHIMELEGTVVPRAVELLIDG